MTPPQPAALPEPLGWYVVNNIGMATLCKDKAEAQLLAEDCDMVYQRQAPHRAVQLAALQSQPAAEVSVAEDKYVEQIMEQAQVFASAWSLVGGRFDFGNALDDANEAKDELRALVARAILALRPQAVPMTEGTARQFVEWMKAQPEDREPTTIDGALAEFEARQGITAQGAQGGEAAK